MDASRPISLPFVALETLVAVTDHKVYMINSYPSIDHAYVARGVYERLRAVARTLRVLSPVYELIILRAYQPPDDSVQLNPFTTGGAVEVSLMTNGKLLAPNSTNLDDILHISELRTAMIDSGFVISENSQHFEWGTHAWAEQTNNIVVLDRANAPPYVIDRAMEKSVTPPDRFPILYSGVAQIFSSSVDRAAALLHERQGHYYARNSHPTLSALGSFLGAHVFDASTVLLTSSGLAACTVTCKALTPSGGIILYDSRIYYETERELIELARERNWQLHSQDFTDLAAVERKILDIEMSGSKVDILFCDNPRNWWLESIDLCQLSKIAHAMNSIVVCDVSLQPLQPALQYVDVVVCSLSKYPSSGLTMGGSIVTNSDSLGMMLRRQLDREANVLSPEAAATIWAQACSLQDRMTSLSQKSREIAVFLEGHKAVTRVRLPNSAFTGGLLGGQVTFHVTHKRLGAMAERAVGQNALRADASLHLACTFGTTITTFEHFASNIRQRNGVAREDTNEIALSDDIIRLGIGGESVDKIISDLQLVLNTALLDIAEPAHEAA